MAKKKQKQPQISPKNYIITKGRTLRIIHCYVTSNWSGMGLSTVTIVRQMPSGKLLIGSYVVDIYCLGIKNTHYFFGIDLRNQFEKILTKIYGNANFDLVTSDLAQNIVWGGLEYAEDLGFEPHPDFKITEYLLDPADKIKYMEIPFGKNGKPFYINGPYDDVDKILAKLNQKLGPNNFNFSITDHTNDYSLGEMFIIDADLMDDEWEYDEWEDDDIYKSNAKKSKENGFDDYIDFEEIK